MLFAVWLCSDLPYPALQRHNRQDTLPIPGIMLRYQGHVWYDYLQVKSPSSWWIVWKAETLPTYPQPGLRSLTGFHSSESPRHNVILPILPCSATESDEWPGREKKPPHKAPGQICDPPRWYTLARLLDPGGCSKLTTIQHALVLGHWSTSYNGPIHSAKSYPPTYPDRTMISVSLPHWGRSGVRIDIILSS